MMPNQLEIAEAEALKLAPEDRVRLANRLIASVFDDADIEEAWAAEVEARIVAIESGRAAPVPAADAISRARSAIK
jgi:putative addiction module component (TIGR02574 family)